MVAKVMDIYLIYEFLRRLVKPFKKWKAYEVGVIDKDGKVIVNKKDRTPEQEKAWGYYDRLLANLKKLLGKVPGGKTRLASFAAALLLLKEKNIDPDDIDYLSECLNFYMNEASMLNEELSNIVGNGKIAGLGIGPDGEPGLTPSQVKRHKARVRKKKREIIQFLKRLEKNVSDDI